MQAAHLGTPVARHAKPPSAPVANATPPMVNGVSSYQPSASQSQGQFAPMQHPQQQPQHQQPQAYPYGSALPNQQQNPGQQQHPGQPQHPGQLQHPGQPQHPGLPPVPQNQPGQPGQQMPPGGPGGYYQQQAGQMPYPGSCFRKKGIYLTKTLRGHYVHHVTGRQTQNAGQKPS